MIEIYGKAVSGSVGNSRSERRFGGAHSFRPVSISPLPPLFWSLIPTCWTGQYRQPLSGLSPFFPPCLALDWLYIPWTSYFMIGLNLKDILVQGFEMFSRVFVRACAVIISSLLRFLWPDPKFSEAIGIGGGFFLARRYIHRNACGGKAFPGKSLAEILPGTLFGFLGPSDSVLNSSHFYDSPHFSPFSFFFVPFEEKIPFRFPCALREFFIRWKTLRLSLCSDILIFGFFPFPYFSQNHFRGIETGLTFEIAFGFSGSIRSRLRSTAFFRRHPASFGLFLCPPHHFDSRTLSVLSLMDPRHREFEGYHCSYCRFRRFQPVAGFLQFISGRAWRYGFWARRLAGDARHRGKSR